MKIRQARPSDMSQVRAIYDSVHPKPDADPTREEKWSLLLIIVAVSDDDSVVFGYTSACLLKDHSLLLVETLVVPPLQGRGIGRKLMEARLRLGTALGAVEAICAHDEHDDHAAMRHLLSSQGFAPDAPGARDELLRVLGCTDPIQVLGRPNACFYSRVLGGWA